MNIPQVISWKYWNIYAVLASAFLIMAAGVFEQSSRRGEQVRIFPRGMVPISGELLSADLQYMTVLLNERSSRMIDQERDQPTLVLVHYEVIDRLRLGLSTYRLRDRRGGIDYQRLSLLSRYATGITRGRIDELLEEYDQDELYELRF